MFNAFGSMEDVCWVVSDNFHLEVFWRYLFQRPNYKQMLIHMLMEICLNSFIFDVIFLYSLKKLENFTVPWIVGNGAKVYILRRCYRKTKPTKFLENKYFFTLIRTHIRKKCFVFRKIQRVLFSCSTRCELLPFVFEVIILPFK